MDTICFDKIYVILIIVAVTILVVYQYISYQQQLHMFKTENMIDRAPYSINGVEPNTITQNHNVVKPTDVNSLPHPTQLPLVVTPQMQQVAGPIDLIKTLDYKTLDDPLTEPSKRQPDYIYGPLINTPYFNYPTRGFQDNYSLYGYLIDKKENRQDDNYMIKLFGRQKYPGSDAYEYYAELKFGGDRMKVPIEQRRELYDDDEVYIDVMKKKYKVKMLPDKTLVYNPYIL